jgi:hypothetical protein
MTAGVPLIEQVQAIGFVEAVRPPVLFLFHQAEPSKIIAGTRHPRNNQAWPAVGILAQHELMREYWKLKP